MEKHRGDLGLWRRCPATVGGARARRRVSRRGFERTRTFDPGLSQGSAKLSGERHEAALKFEKLVRAELAQLGMEKARFEVHFEALADGEAMPSESVFSGGARASIAWSSHRAQYWRRFEATRKNRLGWGTLRLMLALKTVVGSDAQATRRKPAPRGFDLHLRRDRRGHRRANCGSRRSPPEAPGARRAGALRHSPGTDRLLCRPPLLRRKAGALGTHHHGHQRPRRRKTTRRGTGAHAVGRANHRRALKHAATMLKQAENADRA